MQWLCDNNSFGSHQQTRVAYVGWWSSLFCWFIYLASFNVLLWSLLIICPRSASTRHQRKTNQSWADERTVQEKLSADRLWGSCSWWIKCVQDWHRLAGQEKSRNFEAARIAVRLEDALAEIAVSGRISTQSPSGCHIVWCVSLPLPYSLWWNLRRNFHEVIIKPMTIMVQHMGWYLIPSS